MPNQAYEKTDSAAYPDVDARTSHPFGALFFFRETTVPTIAALFSKRPLWGSCAAATEPTTNVRKGPYADLVYLGGKRTFAASTTNVRFGLGQQLFPLLHR